MELQLSAQRPYLLRAMFEWLVDNDLTPHLAVNAEMPGVRVPMQFVQDGQIVLNIAPHAVGNLELGNDQVRFNARFSGQPHAIIVPLYAVEAIYARENGAGTMFPPEPAYESLEESIEDDMAEPEASLAEVETGEELLPEPEAPKPKGRPTLRVIK